MPPRKKPAVVELTAHPVFPNYDDLVATSESWSTEHTHIDPEVIDKAMVKLLSEPWQPWSVRGHMEQLLGTPDVTGWTRRNALALRQALELDSPPNLLAIDAVKTASGAYQVVTDG